MSTKAELLEALDEAERLLGRVIEQSLPTSIEPIAVQQARIRYGEGSLWLRHHIESTKQ